MRLSWRRSSGAEDRFETWITENHQRRVLAAETTPPGLCPDEAFLHDLARRSKRILLSDPRVDHAATCPTCMTRLLILRRETMSHRRKLALAVAIVSCLAIATLIVSIARYGVNRQPPVAKMAVIYRTVDLWEAETNRGQQAYSLQSVSLPAALVRLTIILPRFSTPGQYLIAVTRDQSGNGVMAEVNAAARTDGDKETVSVDLDLRKANAGQYYLSTTHEQDQAAYYYPLQIR